MAPRRSPLRAARQCGTSTNGRRGAASCEADFFLATTHFGGAGPDAIDASQTVYSPPRGTRAGRSPGSRPGGRAPVLPWLLRLVRAACGERGHRPRALARGGPRHGRHRLSHQHLFARLRAGAAPGGARPRSLRGPAGGGRAAGGGRGGDAGLRHGAWFLHAGGGARARGAGRVRLPHGRPQGVRRGVSRGATGFADGSHHGRGDRGRDRGQRAPGGGLARHRLAGRRAGAGGAGGAGRRSSW